MNITNEHQKLKEYYENERKRINLEFEDALASGANEKVITEILSKYQRIVHILDHQFRV